MHLELNGTNALDILLQTLGQVEQVKSSLPIEVVINLEPGAEKPALHLIISDAMSYSFALVMLNAFKEQSTGTAQVILDSEELEQSDEDRRLKSQKACMLELRVRFPDKTKVQIAKRIGLSPAQLSRLCNGDSRLVARNVGKIIQGLGLADDDPLVKRLYAVAL